MKLKELSISAYYNLPSEDQERIAKTVLAVCKMYYKGGDSISVAMSKTSAETRFYKKLVSRIIRSNPEFVDEVNSNRKVRRKFIMSCFSTVQLGGVDVVP